MKVTVILIVIGTLGTTPKGLVEEQEDLEIREQVETIQTTGLLRSAVILRESWRLEKTFCHSNFSGKPSVNAGGKNSQRNYNMHMDDIKLLKWKKNRRLKYKL